MGSWFHIKIRHLFQSSELVDLIQSRHRLNKATTKLTHPHKFSFHIFDINNGAQFSINLITMVTKSLGVFSFFFFLLNETYCIWHSPFFPFRNSWLNTSTL